MTTSDTSRRDAAYDSWLSQAWRVARSNLWLAAIVVTVTLVAAVGATLVQPTTSTSTVTIVVQTSSRGDSETLTRTMAALIGSEAIGAAVQSESGVALSPKQIASRISVDRPPGSGVLTVKVTDTDLERSRAIATAIPPVFASRVERQLRPGQAGELGYFVRSWDADPSTTSNPPPVARNAALGIILGSALAGLVVAARERLLPVVRSASELEDALGVPVVASIPKLQPASGDSELLGRIQALLAGAPAANWPSTTRTILVSGPTSGGDKSTLATWVANAVGAVGTSVILVDADLSTRGLSARLAPGADGLTDYLDGKVDLEDVIVPLHALPVPGVAAKVWFLPAGKTRSPSMRPDDLAQALDRLSRTHFLVVDGPALTASAPLAAALAHIDAVLAVAGEGSAAGAAAEAGRVLRAWDEKPAMGVMLGGRKFESYLPPTGGYWFSQNGHHPREALPAKPASRAPAKKRSARARKTAGAGSDSGPAPKPKTQRRGRSTTT